MYNDKELINEMIFEYNELSNMVYYMLKVGLYATFKEKYNLCYNRKQFLISYLGQLKGIERHWVKTIKEYNGKKYHYAYLELARKEIGDVSTEEDVENG